MPNVPKLIRDRICGTYGIGGWDLVTLKVSKPVLDMGDFTYGAKGVGEQVESLILEA